MRHGKLKSAKKPDSDRLTLQDLKGDLAKIEGLQKRELEKLKEKDKGQHEFFVCLTFQSQHQKEEFLKHTDSLGVNCLYEAYVDGQELAKALGIKITANVLPPKVNKQNPRLSKLVRSKNTEGGKR